MATPTKNIETTAAPKEETAASKEERFELDSKEVSRVLSVIRYRLNEAVRDANRRAPFLSNSKSEARAKATAAFTVLREFSEQTF
ncbi:hypothetical protein [Microbacterium sp. KR10-403]|uniref:hypothetical protein n=1 Tax=Microbacterium sp. KR10-403 TaxID=3158581 RepID=UPI0032E46144